MKEKFLQFFMGKMEKSVYVAAVSIIVCLATVVGSATITHNHNKKIDTALESLAQAKSTAETVSESAAENVSVSDKETNEPNGDKALQYLAEYEKLTTEYEKKRAEMEKDFLDVPNDCPPDEIRIKRKPDISDEEFQREVEKANKENESRKVEYEARCVSVATVNAQIEKRIEQLDNQYKQDVATLKAKYGIA